MATWTKAQQSVIDTRNKNILVSAAAGSGKTAVLVERIIQRIMDKDHPIDVDKIMVVTFTNAAASEMRERILKAIEKELERDPDNLHLRKQQAYIHNAYITTIHSFCLKLVKEHFNDIDLDPAVRVGDTGEMELLKSDVVKEVLEEYYSSESEEFRKFVAQFENRTSDDYLEEMILSLYGKAMGYPWPKKWLDDCVKKYEYADENDLKNSEYVAILNQYADGVLLEIIKQYDTMIDICNNGGPFVYLDILTEEKEQIKQIYDQKDYDKRKVRLNMQFSRLPACKKDSCDPDLKDMVTESRNGVKESIAKLKKRIYSQSIGEAFSQVGQCHEIIKTYVDVTKTFMHQFQEKKKAKNLIDFDDFEHYAIEILVKEEDGKLVPTKTADEIAKDFEEIMVDEYQDSNMVQETLLNALSRERFGTHNRFMVGDVKQSIYGFRGANPDIFVEKYNTYKTGEDDTDYKIILDKNFRSRKGVIDTTNFLFYQMMNRELGNIDYDDENKLYFGAVLPRPDEKDENFIGRIDDGAELILINTKEKPEDSGEFSGNADNGNEMQVSGKAGEQTFKDNAVKKSGLKDNAVKKNGLKGKAAGSQSGNDMSEEETEDEDMEATAFEIEGKVIAARIKELTDREKGMVVFDKELQKYRPLQYSDIVILLRSIGKNADGISSELMKEGIPVYMESKEGYFKTLEIRNVISYLKIIDNPTLDIPMAAVLKSPFAGISDEEIASIRAIGGKDVSLFEDMQLYIELRESEEGEGNVTNTECEDVESINLEKGNEGNDTDYEKKGANKTEIYLPVGIEYDRKLAEKLKTFLEQLTSFRDKVMYMSIYDLVSEVIEKTGYYDFVCAMPSGSQRVANIEMLKAKAAAYENGSYKGLFNFIRYIEKMNKYNIDLGEASIASDSDNTVRIMTIHKSKGLEFPVVFVSNINKQFNLMDAKKKAVVHSKLGIGIDYMDEETRVSKKNLLKFAINKKIELEAIEEELRLFYVACTRAKDKLIFTGAAADEKRILKMTSQRNNHSSYLGYGVVSQFNSYMDFITIPLARNKAFSDIYQDVLGIEPPFDNPVYNEESNVKVSYIRMSDVAGSLVKEKYLETVSTEVLKNLDMEMVYSEKVKQSFSEMLSFRYQYQKQIQSHAKMSVSEIKKISYTSEQKERLAEDAVRFDFMAEYAKYILEKENEMEEEEMEDEKVKYEKLESEEVKDKEVKDEEVKDEEVKDETDIGTDDIGIDDIGIDDIGIDDIGIDDIRIDDINVYCENETKGEIDTVADDRMKDCGMNDESTDGRSADNGDVEEEDTEAKSVVDKKERNTANDKKNTDEEKDAGEEKNPDEESIFTKRKTNINAASRGIVYHTIFEKFDYSMQPTWSNITHMIDQLEKEGIINEEEKKCVWTKHFFEFTKSDLYRRMRKAYQNGQLKREQQFVVGFSESEIEELKRIAKVIGEEGKIEPPKEIEKSGDTILIQGIIDAFFIEDGKIILVDYKTDNVKHEDELIQYYYIQLELYKKAVEQITGMPVSQKILYSTKLGKDIVIE